MIEVTLCAVDVYGVGLLKVKVRFTHDGGQLAVHAWMRFVCDLSMDEVCLCCTYG